MRAPALLAYASLILASSSALADEPTTPPSPVDPGPNEVSDTTMRAPGALDPTGGAYTPPTLLFIPAANVPAWTARVTTVVDMQGPTAPDRLAAGSSVGILPGVGAEMGLPGGFTVGAGTDWVGGDTSPTPISGGISPYLQARYHILGNAQGQGLGLGAGLTYKFVGFQGDPGEMEASFSAQIRQRQWELGLEGVVGKDFATTDADAEGHAYGLYRVIPQLGLGLGTQVRRAIVSQPGETKYDVIGGAIASLTLGRWQVGALGGETTVGLAEGQYAGLGEVFGSVQF